MTSKLTDELSRELEQDRLVSAARLAVRIAESLGLEDYRTLFQAHLDGFDPSDPRPWQRVAKGHQQSVRLMFVDDRRTSTGYVMSHPLPQLQRMLDGLRSGREADADYDVLVTIENIETVRDRIHNRLNEFLSLVQEAPGSLDDVVHGDIEESTMTKPKSVFIGHGRSTAWRDLKDLLVERLGLEVIEFNRNESAAGKTTVERLQEMLDQANFAFLVFTAEDDHPDGTQHARENVVHEAGLFQGRLGFRRAIILLEDGCAEFSNIHGLSHIRFPKEHLTAKTEEIRKVLEREQLI